jgi:large subunit ribosomal protein L5
MRLKEKYNKEVLPVLVKNLGLKNKMQAPRLEKAVINVGLNANKIKESDYSEAVKNTLRKISGQNPVERKAKKSISAFKIRKGQVVGMSVTLRGARMYDFIDKIINVTLARVRDFRGISPKSFDGRGNYSVGFREQIAFPEVRPEDADKLHGLEIVISTTAKDNKEGKELLTLLGFPFAKK